LHAAKVNGITNYGSRKTELDAVKTELAAIKNKYGSIYATFKIKSEPIHVLSD